MRRKMIHCCNQVKPFKMDIVEAIAEDNVGAYRLEVFEDFKAKIVLSGKACRLDLTVLSRSRENKCYEGHVPLK